jgi:tight adherence protein C
MLKPFIESLHWESLRPEFLVGILAFACVMFVGISLMALSARRRQAASKRLALADTVGTRLPVPPKRGLLQVLEQVGNYVSHGRATTSLTEQLIRAGYMSRSAPAVYTGLKMLLFATGLLVTAAVAAQWQADTTQKMMLVSLGGALAFFLPNQIVRMQERKRRQEIQQYLPDAVDLLEICVSSGIGLDMAWNMVAQEIHHVSPVLGSAMDLSNFEIHLGASRTEAMRNMGVRTGAEQLSSLAAILVQSERFGTSVSTALQEFASWMRDERHLRAEEEAEKLPMKLLFPMALFIFPAIMVVAIGPAMIHIFRVLGGN